MQRDNFLLGYGERLTESMAPPPSMMEKHNPYTLDEAVSRLLPEFEATINELKELPGTANPDSMTVAALILHPSFVAKSYYPDALMRALDLHPIGSKMTKIKPKKWTRKERPKEVRSTLVYVEGKVSAFENIPSKLSTIANESNAVADDIVKIEKVSVVKAEEKVRDIQSSNDNIEIEVALHLGKGDGRNNVLAGFDNHLENLGVRADVNKRLEIDGLCFTSVTAKASQALEIAQYSYLRYARIMPQTLPVIRNVPGLSFNFDLPAGGPVDPSMRVAIFDGGIPEGTVLEPWIRRFDASDVGEPAEDLLQHGTGVTGAALFGPLSDGQPAPQPFCFIDHYRILDGNGGDDEISVVNRIRAIIEANNYSYINLSLGPRMPISDDDISPWTVMLDSLLYQKGILATVAAGNDGDLDEQSGNARIQPPSDAVNALAVGAASSAGSTWSRATYSSYGPGRAPGVIKPEVLSFGGSSTEPFYVVDGQNGNTSAPTRGTSFASPVTLRTALGIRAYFGEVLSSIALKALLVHAATKEDCHETKHCGWGRVPVDFREIVTTDNTSVRVVYQGTLNPAEWMNVPVPLPSDQLTGYVTIKASICYFTDTNPEDPVNYTKSGIEIRFRPNKDAKKKAEQTYPDSKPFFQKGQIELFDDELNYNAHFWETTLSTSKRMRATSLNEPVFNLHYNAREAGGRASSNTPALKYAMVVTVTALRHDDLYANTLTRYRTQLEALQPVVQIPIVVR